MRLKRYKKRKGVSLLELLVSLMLFGVIMMTFAMVFPGGYKLSLKNRNESKAANIANGIMEKIMVYNFLGPGISEPTIESLQTWNSSYFPSIFVDPIPEPFYLPDEPSLKGIDVQILDPAVGNGGTLAKITVTVAWKETLKTGTIIKTVSVTTYRSRNH